MSIDPTVQWPVRHDWTPDDVLAVIERPFHDLLADAQHVHRRAHIAHAVEGAMLLSIKTGACPEDCAYCPQSAKWNTGLEPGRLMSTDAIVAAAGNAKAAGATRFCMGAAWRSPNDRQVEQVADAVEAVSALGMETCVTLGMLTDWQAGRLKFAVRNSGATAVVEGVGDHGCEYMTGGRVVVLGSTGRNFAAGMSGGIAYVIDPAGDFKQRCNGGMVDLEEVDDDDETLLRRLVSRHIALTGSTRGSHLLFRWAEIRRHWVKVMPRDYKRVLQAEEAARQKGCDADFNDLVSAARG